MSVNDINFSSNFPQWAKPEQLDVTFVDMSDAVLSYPIKVPASIPHKFSLSWWISVKGEKFYNTTLKPEGYKDDKSLLYNYTLSFKSEREDLKKYVWVDIDKQSGVPLIKSYLNVFKLDINEFASKLNDNLSFYRLSSRWEIRVSPSIAINTEKKLANVENAFIWDVLQQTTEIYGDVARWFIEAEEEKLVIKIGYPAVEINHIFKYGGDTPNGDGGLVKIERTLSAEKLATILAGRGGERNIPERYFEPEGDNFPADPDTNKYTASLNLHNLMPKCFRDYNRGWNSKQYRAEETESYNQGVKDALASTPIKSLYRPIEWVKSAKGIATYGEIWDKLEPKEDIHATIQGIDADTARAAGVITTATGRLDEMIALGDIGNSDPKHENYQATFDIYVPDIGFDLREKTYWAKEEMTVSFSSGWMSQSEDYEFRIRGGGTDEAYVFPDTSQVSPTGQRSAWRITLIKSDAELDATGQMIPNSNPATQPIAGDFFFFTNINLPHSYVLIAEKRQEDYLRTALKEIDHEIPVYSVKPDRIFCASFQEVDKLRAGAVVRLANEHLIDGAYESVHIQSVTLKYDFENRILPDWEMVITDAIVASLNPVQRVSANVSALSQTQITEANVVAKVAAVGDKRWLRKDGMEDVSNSPTKFNKDVSSTNYTGTSFDKAGWAITKHPDRPNESLAIFDNINVRKTFNVYELIANQIKYMGGKMIFSATSMTVLKVEDGGSYWKLLFDTKDGLIKNLWDVGDMVICQEFDAQNIQIRYYRLKVTRASLSDDYIHVSKGFGDIPKADDFIIQHGHVSDKQRQNILTIDTIGGARFTTLQGLTDTNSAGSVVAEMGWIEGKPKFFVGSADSSYIDFDGANKVLNIAAKVVFNSGSSGLGNLDEWAEAEANINNAQSTANAAREQIQATNDYIEVLNSDINAEILAVNKRLDGVIDSYFEIYDPSLTNYPANEWITSKDKESHVGDTFTNKKTGNSWKWKIINSIWGWDEITDTLEKELLQKIAEAKDTADGKRRNFVFTPYTPYEVGDAWSQGSGGDYMRCITSRASGAFVSSDWDLGSKYTDDTVAKDAQQRAIVAQMSANAASSLLADIANDNKLTPSEKQSAKKEWDVIVSEKPKNIAQATTYSINVTAYNNAYNALSAYITPLLSDLNITADINGSVFRNTFKTYYDARQDLLNAITTATKAYSEKLVNDVQIGGVNLALNSAKRLETNQYFMGYVFLSEELKDNEIITISIYGKINAAQEGFYVALHPSSAQLVLVKQNADGNYVGTFAFKKRPNYPNDVRNILQIYNYPNTGNLVGYVDKVQAERGTKATDWAPAPQDVQAGIDDANLAAAELAYLKKTFANSSTSVEGGVVLSSFMGVRPVTKNVSVVAGMCGNTAIAPFLFAQPSSTGKYFTSLFQVSPSGTGKWGILGINSDTVEVDGEGDTTITMQSKLLPSLPELLPGGSAVITLSLNSVSAYADNGKDNYIEAFSNQFTINVSQAILSLNQAYLTTQIVTGDYNQGDAYCGYDLQYYKDGAWVFKDTLSQRRHYLNGETGEDIINETTNKVSIYKNYAYRIKAYASAKADVGYNATTRAYTTTLNSSNINIDVSINKSYIAPNGMAIIYGSNQYNYSVKNSDGALYTEIRSGNAGIRINKDKVHMMLDGNWRTVTRDYNGFLKLI